jgi:hypothetical protein
MCGGVLYGEGATMIIKGLICVCEGMEKVVVGWGVGKGHMKKLIFEGADRGRVTFN